MTGSWGTIIFIPICSHPLLLPVLKVVTGREAQAAVALEAKKPCWCGQHRGLLAVRQAGGFSRGEGYGTRTWPIQNYEFLRRKGRYEDTV